eukprot:COSAG03_NODE_19978_length_326_cov_1.568282_1_plen_42_part_10
MRARDEANASRIGVELIEVYRDLHRKELPPRAVGVPARPRAS